jgi:TRAP-type uncharacterized transport system substrate-binding protein
VKKKTLLIPLALMLAVTLVAMGCPPPVPVEPVVIRLATSPVGTYGYKVTGFLAAILEEEFPPHYKFFVYPYPGTIAAMKGGMHGETELMYFACVGLTELYAGTGPFVGFVPKVAKMVQTFFTFPMETFLAVHDPKAHLFESWACLSGEPVFFAPAGFMNWLNAKRAWAALGYEFHHIELGLPAVADALAKGTIEAAVMWTTAGRTLVPWAVEAELKVDVTVLNPTPEEREKLAAAGLSPIRVDPGIVFVTDVGVEEIWGVPLLFGFNVRPDMCEYFVYRMLEAFERRVACLYKLEPGFELLKEDFVGLQVAGIKLNPHIPVHPGLTRFLKERDAWDPAWIIYGEE